MNTVLKTKMISTTSALWLFGALLFWTINPPLKAICELATLNIESKTHLTIFCKSSFFPSLIISIYTGLVWQSTKHLLRAKNHQWLCAGGSKVSLIKLPSKALIVGLSKTWHSFCVEDFKVMSRVLSLMFGQFLGTIWNDPDYGINLHRYYPQRLCKCLLSVWKEKLDYSLFNWNK